MQRDPWSKLGPLELDVMNIVWKLGPECSVNDVHRKTRHLAPTTIMTTMRRLTQKGFLVYRKESRAFLYTAAVSREEVSELAVRAFLADLAGSPNLLISCLVESAANDPALLEELESKIRLKREQLGDT